MSQDPWSNMGPSIYDVTLQGGGGQAKCDSLWQGGGVNVVWRHTIKKFIVVPPLILYTNLFNIY